MAVPNPEIDELLLLEQHGFVVGQTEEITLVAAVPRRCQQVLE